MKWKYLAYGALLTLVLMSMTAGRRNGVQYHKDAYSEFVGSFGESVIIPPWRSSYYTVYWMNSSGAAVVEFTIYPRGQALADSIFITWGSNVRPDGHETFYGPEPDSVRVQSGGGVTTTVIFWKD